MYSLTLSIALWEQIILICKKMELYELFYQSCEKALEELNGNVLLSTRSEKASLGYRFVNSLKSRIHILIGQQNEQTKGVVDPSGLASQDPIKHYLNAVQIGVNLKDDRTACNAISCIYNHFRSSFVNGKFMECVPAFSECFSAITLFPSVVEEVQTFTVSLIIRAHLSFFRCAMFSYEA